MDYSAIGQTTHLAARMEQMAMPGSSLITQAVLGLAEGYVHVKPLGPVPVKGLEAPVDVYELVGARGGYHLAQPLASLQVPTTVQAVLAARIDRLPVGEKRLLQTAAVIGHNVPLALLQAIAELPEEVLHRSLTQLQRAEFLYEMRLFLEREHTFKHALTHEVAYGSLLQGRRRVLHARIVEALEELYADRLAEQVDRLAYHARRGELWEKAVAYCYQAGAKARDRVAYREASIRSDQSLAALAHVPVSPAMTALAIDVRLDLCVLHILGEYGQSLTLLSEADVLAQALNDRSRLGRVLVQKTFLLRMMADHPGAIAIGQQALAIAADLGDRAMQVAAAHRLGQPYFAIGAFGQAAALHRHSDHIARLSKVCLLAGRHDEAWQHARRALDLARQYRERGYEALALRQLGAVYVHADSPDVKPAETSYRQALALAEQLGMRPLMAHCHLGLGRLYCQTGRVEQARTALSAAIGLYRTMDMTFWLPQAEAALAQVEGW
jgi:predicted ATPase